jgi:hypothetical protein
MTQPNQPRAQHQDDPSLAPRRPWVGGAGSTERPRRAGVLARGGFWLGVALCGVALGGCAKSSLGPAQPTAAKVVFTVQPSNAAAGAMNTPAVQVAVEDAQGNTVTTANTSITVAIGTNPASGTLAGTKTVAAVNGVATFSTLSLNLAGAGYTLTASATGLTGATSSAFNITAGSAAKLVFIVQPSDAVAGAAIAPGVQLALQDAQGNTLTTATTSITLAIGTNPASGTLAGTTTVAATSGVATFSTLSLNTVGTGYTLTATATGLTSATSNAFNITVGAAAKLVFTVQPSNAVAGAAIAPAMQVTIQDAHGNTLTTATTSITVAIGTNPASGTLAGTATVAAASGVATFSTLSLNAAGTGYTLTASATGLTGATSSPFNISAGAVPPGSCSPSSSVFALVSGTNVVSYVPKGSWSFGTTGVSAVNVEGTSITNTLIPTPNAVNSCASNPLTGTTVCTANNTDVYKISGTTLVGTLTSGASGAISFSGGSCTNCGIAMDAAHDQAVIGLSIGGVPGFQFLKNLSTSSPSFEAPFASASGNISEDPLIDPLRNRLLSAAENDQYEIIDVTTTTRPSFFENAIVGVPGKLDSSGEDCSTQIALAPAEFTGPSQVYIADITTPPAVFTAGTPGSWSVPSQVQTLSESFLSEGANGIAVAQGTHLGIVAGEFGGDAITAIALPTTSGGGATPAITDWVTCNIGAGFLNGFDPHTVTAYQSPNGGHAIALLANGAATTLAVVDLTNMLNSTIVARTGTGHGCASGPLPGTVVRFVAVP